MQSITLQTNDSVISSGDALGQVQFAASAESDGGASRLIGAKIYAQGEGAFNASSNPTSIIFATSAADNLPASGKIKIDDNGNIIPLLTQNYNLGSSSSEFASLYVSDSIYVSGIALIDGSNYTIGADTYSLASGVIVDGGDSSSANVDLLFRRDLDSEWESNNPVLASGEPGWDITNKVLKVGNGVDAWNDLQGITGGGGTLDLSYSRGFFLLNEPSGTFTVDGGYTVGYLDVYLNGVKLFPSGDYTATNGNNFTLSETAPSGSVIEYVVPTIGSVGPVAGEANQIVYKNPSNEPSGNANFTFIDSSTTLNVDNISIDDNTISATSGDVSIVPFDSGNVLIGTSGVASGVYSSVIGGLHSKTELYGEISHSAGKFNSDGDARHSIVMLRGNTTDFTETELFLDGVDQRLVIPSNTSFSFTAKINAYDRKSKRGAWWAFNGGIRNSDDSVAIVGDLTEEKGYEGILGDCSVNISADDTYKSLKITVVGIRGNIRWVALVDGVLVNGDPELPAPTFNFEEFLEINTSTNNYTNLLLN